MFYVASRMMLKAIGATWKRRLSIVYFHRVLSAPDPLLRSEPTIADFAERLRWLSAAFNVLPLTEAVERLKADTLPSGALSITFDDGYRDNALNALPVLRSFGLPATFFVATQFLDGTAMWNDQVTEAVRHWPHPIVDLAPYGLQSVEIGADRAHAADRVRDQVKYLPHPARQQAAKELLARADARIERMMMDEAEIRALRRQGMEIGGHTVSHPILSGLDEGAAREEIAAGKSTLEAIIGEKLHSFAYPNGIPNRDYTARDVELVRRCGFQCAVTTAKGSAPTECTPWELPRFTPWDHDHYKYLSRMVGNYFVDGQVTTDRT